MFLGFSFAIFLIFTHPSPGWYYWLLPFLFYFFAKSSSKELMMVLLLQIAFLLYFLLDKNVNFIIYKGNFLSVSIPFIDYFQQHLSIDRNLLINLSFTFLQSLLIFNCYLISRKNQKLNIIFSHIALNHLHCNKNHKKTIFKNPENFKTLLQVPK